MKLPVYLVSLLIDALMFIRPILGPRGVCRSTISCSQYAHQQLLAYPVSKACLAIVQRVLRCNPFFPPVYD